MPWVLGLLTLFLAVDPDVAHDPAPVPLSIGQIPKSDKDTTRKKKKKEKTKNQKKNLQANISDEYRCKNPQRNIRKTKFTVHYKDHTMIKWNLSLRSKDVLTYAN